jgi:integrase
MGCGRPNSPTYGGTRSTFAKATLQVRRVKSGTPSTHPLQSDEMRALRRLQHEQEQSQFVFTSERDSPFTTAGFARMLERAAVEAKIAIKVHPHMLRHACGFALANAGHDTRALQAYLGHRNIVSDVIRPPRCRPEARRRTAATRRCSSWGGGRRSWPAHRADKLADRRRSSCKFR